MKFFALAFLTLKSIAMALSFAPAEIETVDHAKDSVAVNIDVTTTENTYRYKSGRVRNTLTIAVDVGPFSITITLKCFKLARTARVARRDIKCSRRS